MQASGALIALPRIDCKTLTVKALRFLSLRIQFMNYLRGTGLNRVVVRHIGHWLAALGLLVGFASSCHGQSRYGYSNDGSEVTDNKSDMTWRRCGAGQSWSGTTCTGTALTYTHEAALAYAKTQTGWRLPNVKELSSIVNRTPGSAGVDVVAFPGGATGCNWTSTPNASDPASAWQVELGGNRFVATYPRTYACAVRLVR